MLQLLNICKSYTTADFTQTALDNVSVSFRDNEFVAILGPSGSGKTTLLNIVGGLDHYDSGNLIIDGISTEQYKDKDWDAYRNNRIGFVFQSYNLYPHKTVLENVTLAPIKVLKVPREQAERDGRAYLERVGLSDKVDKYSTCIPRSCCWTSPRARSIPRWCRRCSTSSSRWPRRT